MTFIRCDPGWYVDNTDVQNIWDDNTHTHTSLALYGDAFEIQIPMSTGHYDEQGKYAEAEPLYERSQAIREKALGLDHPDVASSLNHRARLLTTQVIHVF